MFKITLFNKTHFPSRNAYKRVLKNSVTRNSTGNTLVRASGILLIVLTSFKLSFAATVYIDPVDGSNAYNGLYETYQGGNNGPWENFYNLSDVASWDIALVKRGTTMTISTGTTLQDITTPKIIAAYGTGNKPIIRSFNTITSGWTQPDSIKYPDVWMWEDTTQYWNPPHILGFSNLGNYGKRVPFVNQSDASLDPNNAPANAREWDYFQGSTGIKSKLYCYSVGNPANTYGIIYYQTGQRPALQLKGVQYLTLKDLSFKYGYTAVSFGESPNISTSMNNVFENLDLTYLWYGLKIVSKSTYWISGTIVKNCTIRSCLNAGIILLNNVEDANIYNNKIEDSCLSESTGGIYTANIRAPVDKPVRIRDNYIKAIRFGNYWPLDGGGVEVDHNSQNVWVYRNIILNSYHGLHDNSGSAGNKYFCNRVQRCDYGYFSSDGLSVGQINIEIYNNSFLNCGEIGNQGLAPGTHIISLGGGSSSIYLVRNNCLIGSQSTVNGIRMNSFVYDGGGVTEDHNAYYRLNYEITRNTQDKSTDVSTTSIVDISPDIEWTLGGYPLAGSILIDAGNPTTTVEDNQDVALRPMPKSTIDIGAQERQ